MIYNGKVEKPIKMHDLGGKPTIFGNIHIWNQHLEHFNPGRKAASTVR